MMMTGCVDVCGIEMDAAAVSSKVCNLQNANTNKTRRRSSYICCLDIMQREKERGRERKTVKLANDCSNRSALIKTVVSHALAQGSSSIIQNIIQSTTASTQHDKQM